MKILIADDHELVRKGLRAVLEEQPGWKVCGEAVNGRHAVELAKQLRPDVIVLDITMPELNGPEATRQIRKALPDAEVLILTMHESDQLVSEVLAAGARGYILKADTSRLLVTAIESLSQHKPFFTGKVLEVLVEGNRKPGDAAKRADKFLARLTAREREVLQLVAEGKFNKEVADALGIAVKTVEAHRFNIMHKLDLHSVTELVHYAIRNQMVAA
jgi:DNA-binding NarL/FixJ family response regulator